MGYTTFKNPIRSIEAAKSSLKGAALGFIRESCEGLRFDEDMAKQESAGNYLGTSLKPNQIPYNMQMDVDRLAFENALSRFLDSGMKEDAFDVYFCYLEMFVGKYGDSRRMIELLSEFEANGSGLLMKHRDHYSHSVYVFALGLAIYNSISSFRNKYARFYSLEDERAAAHHFLKFWGLASLFHDIGYPFELPFEQVESYFDVKKEERKNSPYMKYKRLDKLVTINGSANAQLREIFRDEFNSEWKGFADTNELFAYDIWRKLGEEYHFDKNAIEVILRTKPTNPDCFNHFMDHAYFSANILFKELGKIESYRFDRETVDALTAIILHNSLYKFSIAYYKDKQLNVPFKAENHPLAFLLMLCDELQCWDRVAYGRNSKLELHPMSCEIVFNNKEINVTYLFDENEKQKTEYFEKALEAYEKDLKDWEANGKPRDKEPKKPKLKAYSEMYAKNGEESAFLKDIKRIVDLSEISLAVSTSSREKSFNGASGLSSSNFFSLYNFAVVLNGRWSSADWKTAHENGLEAEEKYLLDKDVINGFAESFDKLSLEYKLSNINQAKAFAGYMDLIGCFYTDKQVDFKMVESFEPEELGVIGILEHRRWLQEHYDMGWTYGEPEKTQRDLLRQHKDMIPGYDGFEVTAEAAKANYDRLDKGEQDKDTEPMSCMLALLKMYDGLRIYRLKMNREDD